MKSDAYVFSSDVNLLGVIDTLTGIIWQEEFSSVGKFELWCPLTILNGSLLQPDNIIWTGKDSAGIVESKELQRGSDGTFSIHIAGRLAECYLDYRTIFPVFVMKGKAGSVVRSLVDQNLINPTNQARKISTVSLNPSPEQPLLGDTISYQQTGGLLASEISGLCEANSLGFRLKFNPPKPNIQPGFIFTLYKGVDRSIDQDAVDPVIFSSELDDILESTYFYNKADFRNVAYVAGEDTGENRKIVETDHSQNGGVHRRELFVDARDIQSEQNKEVIPEADYQLMLVQRGDTKLEDYKEIENFSSSIKTFGNTSYVYGKDFFLGDIVTVYDKKLRVKVNARVTSCIDTYDENGYSLTLVFGYEQPTIANKLRRRT